MYGRTEFCKSLHKVSGINTSSLDYNYIFTRIGIYIRIKINESGRSAAAIGPQCRHAVTVVRNVATATNQLLEVLMLYWFDRIMLITGIHRHKPKRYCL